MANIKSAKKRIKVAASKAMRNKSVKSRVKTELKKLETIIEAGDKSAAEAQVKVVISYIDKAESKGVFHKNAASRKVSSVDRAFNKMA
ncbi:MAG: 30S ribosomal protein S20 [Firmicutes bacterium HGW-Firmicutes-2]|jgi:small subunit ribosomal protein S20|nr:MAG: 30S ribosomal protein S20 [Firmicutes bacterium HGW-Firmicutes-2]